MSRTDCPCPPHCEEHCTMTLESCWGLRFWATFLTAVSCPSITLIKVVIYSLVSSSSHIFPEGAIWFDLADEQVQQCVTACLLPVWGEMIIIPFSANLWEKGTLPLLMHLYSSDSAALSKKGSMRSRSLYFCWLKPQFYNGVINT